MEKLVFIEKNEAPNEQLLISTLKNSYEYYSKIFEKLQILKPGINIEWKYYGKKNGWLLKHLDKKKNLFFLVPYAGFFNLTFTFGDKAISQILASEIISSDLKELIQTSKKYAEGTSIFLPVKSDNEVEQAIELVKFKLV